MIIITDEQGRTITFAMYGASVEISSPYNFVKISRDDARQLRRFLENLG